MLFTDPPKKPSARYRRGSDEFRGMVGGDKYRMLRDLGDVYRLQGKDRRPKEPDLFAFKDGPDDAYIFKAVEVKVNDPVRDDQLLGLALIERVLGCEIGIWRYRPVGKDRPTATHMRNFQPGK